jgi:hypothetical protein
MHPPKGLSAAYFSEQCAPPHDNNLLSDGLRQFGEGLEQLQSRASPVFLSAADNAAAASAVLEASSALSNGRVIAALHHLPPRARGRFDGVICAAEIYRMILYEREAIRIVEGGDAETYSRLCDVLNFISTQPDVVACISAHRTIEEAYALAASAVPCLHFKHHTARNRLCYFTCKNLL